jgi:Ca2+/Na+ antiporter
MSDPNLANLTAQVEELRLELATITHDMAANNNAFFLVTMALIIFCELSLEISFCRFYEMKAFVLFCLKMFYDFDKK